jgi:endonuclease/exonuclease/phosphatase family metal-dependent hydrolase
MDLLEDISILSWNIRGALGKQSRCQVRDIINSCHPSLVLLYETHGVFSKVERKWISLGYNLVFIQEARGHSGGIWILSNRTDLCFTLIDSISQAITFTISKGLASWCCTAVYGSPVYTIRTSLWTHLKNLRNNIISPWLMIGDFNEIKSIDEVAGGSFNFSRANPFIDMINYCNLLDMDTAGGFFTWRRSTHPQTHIRKRLDRCMVDVDWRLAFPHALVEILSPHNSDHNPLLVSCSKARSIKSNMFHFQAAWISHPDYEPLVDNTWRTSVGTPTYKLTQVRDHSITFNKDIFGNIFKNKRILEARIRGVHKQLDNHQTSDLILFERKLQQEYNKILSQEEMLWYQKSRENWVKYGNRNTKFFHTQTIIRRRRNKISGLNVENIWCTDASILKREASKFFMNLFQSNDPCNPQSL